MNIIRSKIIESLHKLQAFSFIYAVWLDGSDTTGTTDEFSDIDVWLDIEDGQENAGFEALENILAEFAPIDIVLMKTHPDPKLRHQFYRLKNTSPFLIIDVVIQLHSRNFHFMKRNKSVIFDKANVIQYQDVDTSKMHEMIKKRCTELECTFNIQSVSAEREVRRGNFLSAFAAYQQYVLEPLVELLRTARRDESSVYLSPVPKLDSE